MGGGLAVATSDPDARAEARKRKRPLPNNRLEASVILDNLELLERRIRERFPQRSLGDTCREMTDTARETSVRVANACRPHIGLRVGVGVVIGVVALGAAALVVKVWPPLFAIMTSGADEAGLSAAAILESIVNLGLLAALGVWSLVSLEARLRRRTVLAYLHELRRFAHVIDMHQLNKDPVAISDPTFATPSSPVRDMSEYDLSRYLDYCSEMLSLIGKLAALYSENAEDPEIVAAASDIETLTTNMGRKIWQKISLISVRPAPTH